MICRSVLFDFKKKTGNSSTQEELKAILYQYFADPHINCILYLQF